MCAAAMEGPLAGVFHTVRQAGISWPSPDATISDRQGLAMRLNELGPSISAAELKQLYKLLEASIGKASWLMICGSIPPGVPPHFYCDLITLARSRDVKTLLDTDGEALAHALETHPTVIKPNQQEAERLLGTVLITKSQFIEAVDRMRAMGAESVILSLGSRGAIAKNAQHTWEVIPPRVDASTRDCRTCIAGGFPLAPIAAIPR